MGVQTDHSAIAAREVTAKPFDLVRIYVWRRHLYRTRQINDDGRFRRSPPCVGNRCANLRSKIQFRAGKALGGIFEGHIGFEIFQSFAHQGGPFNGQIDYALARHAKDHSTLQFRRGVVEVEDHIGCAF